MMTATRSKFRGRREFARIALPVLVTLAFLGLGLGATKSSKAAVPTAFSEWCPMYEAGSGGGMWYYYAALCPVPNGQYRGMSSPVKLTTGCGSSACVPATVSRRAPAPTSQMPAVPGKYPPVPGKGLPTAMPFGEPDDGCELGEPIFGSYQDGQPITNGLDKLPPLDFKFVADEKVAELVSDLLCRGEVEGRSVLARVIRLRITPVEQPDCHFELLVGQEVEGEAADAVPAKFEPSQDRVFKVEVEGEAGRYDVILKAR